jgi:plastocyanin
VKRRTLAVAGVSALALGVWAGPASGLGPPEVTAVDDNYLGATPNILEGQVLLFSNDGPSHNHTVTADDKGPDGKPLFDSGTLSPGDGPEEVAGVPFLGSGSYDFHCRIHPSDMTGTLTVTDSPGGPVPRPDIDVKVKSKKLAKVVKSGKLKVEVSAAEPTRAEDVSLSAKKGRKTITKKASLTVNAGNSETAKLKLKKSAIEKLAELDNAKVKVTGEVDFGSPAKASRKLK